MITGVLSLSNAAGLDYPFLPVVCNLSSLCDWVLVGVDPNFPADKNLIESIGLPNVECVDSVWNKTVDNGNEIALQMDKLVSLAGQQGSGWVVVLQADEMLNDEDFSLLRSTMEGAPASTIGLSTERLYFWGSFDKVRQDWNAWLVRIFRTGYFSFMAENTDKGGMFSAPIKEGDIVEVPCKVHHYSRIGDAASISRRVRNLDTFFHAEENLLKEEELPEYDFKGREFDNFNKNNPPPEKELVIVDYNGTHPKGIMEWYE